MNEMTTRLTGLKPVPALLNLGCGRRFHPAWINLDASPAAPTIRVWNVTQQLPFADASFDAVYHSHLLEHLRPTEALPFLRDCRRVLRPGGTLRVVVPDLEAIARLYLDALDDAWAGDPAAAEAHRWLVMELYDQTTRETPGGAMAQYLQQHANTLAWFRIGADGAILKQHLTSLVPARPATWAERAKGMLFGSWRERALRWLLGAEYDLLQIGRFRRIGEVHHWMYDRVSLREFLTSAGLVNVRCVSAMESAIPNWSAYQLDATADGAACKPDSLFVEASGPPA